MDHFYYLFVILLFIAIFLMVEGVYLSWNSSKGPEAKRVERRLRKMSAGGNDDKSVSMVKQRLLAEGPVMQRLLSQLPRINSVDQLLQQSGLTWSVAELFGLAGLAWVGTFL